MHSSAGLSFHITEELKARIWASARERGQTLTMWIVRAMEAELARGEAPAAVPDVEAYLAAWRRGHSTVVPEFPVGPEAG